MERRPEILLSTAYLGPAQYFSKLATASIVHIEKFENYTKQTYRNRCIIGGPNGLQALSVPVKKGSFHKVAIRDLEIEYGKPWQLLHWRSITAAYSSSPYFEYYQDCLRPFYDRKIRFLIDLNMELTGAILREIGVMHMPRFTGTFMPPGSTGRLIDLRHRILPKSSPADPDFHPLPYIQVFRDRHGFLPNLSIIDVLFNLGPGSLAYLESCSRRPEEARKWE